MKITEYKDDIKNRAKHLFLEKEMNPRRIARELGWPEDGPAPQSIYRWSKKKDENGKSWCDLRKENSNVKYLEMSPQNMATLILKKIHALLQNTDMDDAKLADALLKMQKIMSQLLDPDLQIPVMYKVLEDYVLYCKKHHTEMVTEDFLESLRGFKNHVRARIQLDFSS